MNSHVTERNTQIIAAYTAGNRNKSELARYFGVSEHFLSSIGYLVESRFGSSKRLIGNLLPRPD